MRQSKFAEAKEIGIRMVSSDPDFVAGLDVQAQGEFGLGNFEDSLKLANEGLAKFNNQNRFIRSKLIALHALGKLDEVKQMRDDLFGKAESELVSPMTLALAEYCSGNEEAAIQKLNQALKDKDVWLFPLDPRKDFESLNGNPRFDAIWEKVGLPPLEN